MTNEIRSDWSACFGVQVRLWLQSSSFRFPVFLSRFREGLFCGSARFAVVNSYCAVLAIKIFVRDAFYIGRSDSLEPGSGRVDLAPITFAIIKHQLHEDGKIGGEAPIFCRGKVVFYFLKFIGRDFLLFELLNTFQNALLDL